MEPSNFVENHDRQDVTENRDRENAVEYRGHQNVTEYRDRVDTIREVFSYLKQFRGTTFVVRIDNAVLDDPLFSVVVKDLSLLHEAGIRVALVPSAKERIDEVLRRYEVPYTVINGVRVTSEEAIPFIKMAAFDVSNRVMTMLSANGMTAVIGNWVRARGIGVIDGVDYQSAGLVESVRVDTVRKVLDDGVVPIFPCIGWSSVGTPYNISSNELAVVVATSLARGEADLPHRAGRVFAADAFAVPETIPVAPGGRLANFSLADLDAFFAANPGREADLELLQRARRACAGGVERVHILDGRGEGVILKETFSNLGSGTMVYSNRYGGIRPMTHERHLRRAAHHAAVRGAGHPPAPHRGAARRDAGRTSSSSRWTTPCTPAPPCTSSRRRPERSPASPWTSTSCTWAWGPSWWTSSASARGGAGLSSVFVLTTQTCGLVPEAGVRGGRPCRPARKEAAELQPPAEVAHLREEPRRPALPELLAPRRNPGTADPPAVCARSASPSGSRPPSRAGDARGAPRRSPASPAGPAARRGPLLHLDARIGVRLHQRLLVREMRAGILQDVALLLIVPRHVPVRPMAWESAFTREKSVAVLIVEHRHVHAEGLRPLETEARTEAAQPPLKGFQQLPLHDRDVRRIAAAARRGTMQSVTACALLRPGAALTIRSSPQKPPGRRVSMSWEPTAMSSSPGPGP